MTKERLSGELGMTLDAWHKLHDENKRLRTALSHIRDGQIIQGMSPELFAEKVLEGTTVEPDASPHVHEWHNANVHGTSCWWRCKCGETWDSTGTGYRFPEHGMVYVTPGSKAQRAEALRASGKSGESL